MNLPNFIQGSYEEVDNYNIKNLIFLQILLINSDMKGQKNWICMNSVYNSIKHLFIV